MAERKYRRTNRICSLAEYEKSSSTWFEVQNGTKIRMWHKGALESLQVHTFRSLINRGLYETERTSKYFLTEDGKAKAKAYIAELKAKRKEILDAKKDTAKETKLPTLKDILADIEFQGIDEEGEYCNSWGVTDNYDADSPLCLLFRIDFI